MVDGRPSAAALAAHERACAMGEAGYLDPVSGLFVMTSVYLREQGACCGSGCRHCPYDSTEQRAAGRPGVEAWPHGLDDEQDG